MNTVETTRETRRAAATTQTASSAAVVVVGADTAAAAAVDAAAKARKARFGTLPEPIPFSALVEEVPATPKSATDYDAERSWLHYSCLALDLGF